MHRSHRNSILSFMNRQEKMGLEKMSAVAEWENQTQMLKLSFINIFIRLKRLHVKVYIVSGQNEVYMVSFYTEKKTSKLLVLLTIKTKEKLNLQGGIQCVFAVCRCVHWAEQLSEAQFKDKRATTALQVVGGDAFPLHSDFSQLHSRGRKIHMRKHNFGWKKMSDPCKLK